MIDLGGGEAVAFKVESHNHPSAVEPFQGAATGVGGILRDIVAMGARPIALLDGLRFGAPDHHFDRAVAGIGAYGNSVGVPTVGGEAVFHPAYADNCLVNAMCVGLLPSDRVTRAGARTPGHQLVLYGATTGRDGIGGASVLASQELGEGAAEKRPSVQIGDPFTGKKLIEVSVELVERGLVESLQDCGAAGLASALAEMARDGAGVDVHLDRVPLREELEPWEIMISESQERMVAVVRPGFLEAVEEVCARWELHCTPIGEVTDTGELRAFHSGETLGEIPAHLLTDEAPRYRVEPRPRAPLAPRRPILRPLCPSCSPRRTSAAAPGSTSATTTWSARGPCAARAWTPRCCGSGPRCGGSRCPWTALRRTLRGRRAWRARWRSWRRRATSRAPAGSPWPDRLPQLRQPGEAGGRMGARRGDRGDGPRGGGARRAGRLRKRLALQRDRRARDPADAGRRLRRARAGRARRPEPVAGGRRRGRRRARYDPAAPHSTSARRRGWSSSSGARRRCSRSRTTSPTAASPSRSPRLRSGAGSAPTSSCPRPGRAVIACAPEDLERLGGVPLLAVGVVDGDTVLGFGLDELGKAYGL